MSSNDDLQTVAQQTKMSELIDVKMRNDIYTAFPRKFKQEMVLSPSTINPIVLDNQNVTNTSQTTFSTKILEDMLYSNLVTLTSDIELSFDNVKVKSDYDLFPEGAYPPTWLTDENSEYYIIPYGKTEADADSTFTRIYKSSDDSGDDSNPAGFSANPFNVPEFSLASNFLNSYQAQRSQVNLTTNSIGVGDTTEWRDNDVMVRQLKYGDTQAEWNGILIPQGPIHRGMKLLAHKKMCPYTALSTAALNTQCYVSTRYEKVKDPRTNVETELYHGACDIMEAPFPTYKDIESDPHITNTSSKRGQIFKNLDCTYTFTKTKPSLNFKLVVPPGRNPDNNNHAVDTYKIVPDGTTLTTTLYSVFYQDQWQPTNIALPTGMTGDEAFRILGDLLDWRYDNLNPCGFYRPEITDEPKKNPRYYWIRNEPDGQALNIKIQIKDLVSPLFTPLFAMMKSTNVFSNTSVLKVDLSTSQQLLTLIDYMGHLNLVQQKVNDDDVIFNIRHSNSRLCFTQYSVTSMTSALNKQTTIFYRRFDRTCTINGDKVLHKNTPNTIVFNRNAISIGNEIPHGFKFYVQNYHGAKIKKITAIVNNSSGDVLGQRSVDELYNMSRDNGLIGYRKQDFMGYTPTYPFHNSKYSTCVGSVISLLWSDFGFQSQLFVSGVTGVNLSISFTIEAELPMLDHKDGDRVTPQMNVVMEFHNHMNISNSAGTTGTSLWTAENIVEAITDFKQEAESGRLSINVKRLIYGGSLTGFLQGLKHMGSRGFNTGKALYQAARDIYQPAKDLYNKGSDAFSRVTKAARGGSQPYANFL